MALEAMRRNGHNLHIGEFPHAGEFDIPVLASVTEMPEVDWLPFNRVKAESKRAAKGIHFFMDDYIFERCWNDPIRYAQLLREFGAVMSPDFSMFTDYPRPVQIYNHWRKHHLAAYWQSWGMTVIPSICWSDHSSYSWCFDGEPKNSIVAVSSMGTQKNPIARGLFYDGFVEMIDRLHPTGVIWYGVLPQEFQRLNIPIAQIHPFYSRLAHAQNQR